MGSVHFLIPKHLELNANAVNCAYMVGADGVPWESYVKLSEDRLVVTRDTNESGRLVVIWNVAGHGPLALSTGTLAPSDRPYHLPLELARGSLARLHTQLHAAETRGFQLTESNLRRLQDATNHFVRAALAQSDIDRSATEAHRSLEHTLTLIGQLGSNERVTSSGGSGGGTASVWGATVQSPRAAKLLSSIRSSVPNVVLLQQRWCDLELNPGEWNWQVLDDMIEMIDIDQYRVGYGPLVTLERRQLPDWLYLWEDDFEAIHSYVSTYVQQVVSRYVGRFRFWLCSAGTNVDEALGLTEEQRLKLTVSILENVRHGDPRTPVLVAVRQPWGEYLGRSAFDLTPLQFADILVRGDLGLSAIGLQIEVGCSPGQSLPRDLLEFNQLIDNWSQLGLPLVILLSVQSDSEGVLKDGHQLEFIEMLLRLLGRKSAVHGVVWDPLVDHAEQVGGLLTEQGAAKPIFGSLRRAAGGVEKSS